MFGAIKSWVQQWLAEKALAKLPAIQIARMAIHENWSNNKVITQDFSRDLVDGQASLMMQKAIEIATSETPWLENRKFLAECVIEYAQFAVLVLEPPPADDLTGFRGMPGITGELKQHYLEIAMVDEGLRVALGKLPQANNSNAIWDFIVLRNRQLWAWSSVFQSIRFAYNDHAPKGEEDWYRPFVAAMFAWQENMYRESLGLPSMLEDQCEGLKLRALVYSTFMNRVTNGEANPLKAWRADLEGYDSGYGRTG